MNKKDKAELLNSLAAGTADITTATAPVCVFVELVTTGEKTTDPGGKDIADPEDHINRIRHTYRNATTIVWAEQRTYSATT